MPILKKLAATVWLFAVCGCSSSYQFISTNQPEQIKDFNREIENARVIIDQNNGDEIKATIVKVTADSVFYINSEPRSLSTSKVNSIRVGSKAHGFSLLGIALIGYGVYQIATIKSANNVPDALGKRYGGITLLVLGGGSLSLGYYDFEHTYYLN